MLVIESRHGGREKYQFKGGLVKCFNEYTIADGDLVTLPDGTTYMCKRSLYPSQTFIVHDNNKTFHYTQCYKCDYIYDWDNSSKPIYIGGYWDNEKRQFKYRKLPKKHIDILVTL